MTSMWTTSFQYVQDLQDQNWRVIKIVKNAYGVDVYLLEKDLG